MYNMPVFVLSLWVCNYREQQPDEQPPDERDENESVPRADRELPESDDPPGATVPATLLPAAESSLG